MMLLRPVGQQGSELPVWGARHGAAWPMLLSPPTPSPPPQCNVFINRVSDEWKQRVSIVVYAMVIVATVGWVLFMVFGAIGIVTLPLDWIRQFIGRPKATITRSQYIDRARDLARRAKVGAAALGAPAARALLLPLLACPAALLLPFGGVCCCTAATAACAAALLLLPLPLAACAAALQSKSMASALVVPAPTRPRLQDILALADALKREERERGRGWRWRRNAKALNTQLLVLEEDERQLEMVYPQVWGGAGLGVLF